MDTHRLREDDLVWREVGDEVVILDMRQSLYANLNASGRLLWLRLAQQGASSADLAGVLQATYGLDDASARRDADAFLDRLAEQGLLG